MKFFKQNATWILIYIFLVLLPLTGLAWFYLYSFNKSQTATELQNIASIADKKANEIEVFVNERIRDAAIHSKRQSVLRAIPELTNAFRIGGTQAVLDAGQKYQVEYQMLVEQGLFYDVMLLDLQGNVIFSILHEADFGQNVVHGTLKNTTLAESFAVALSTLNSDLGSFRPYAPSNNKIAAFIVAPVMVDGTPIGAMAFQLNLDNLIHVVSDRTGLGQTGEVVLAENINGQPIFTAPLRNDPNAAFKRTVPSTYNPPLLNAITGQHAQGVRYSYAGEPVLAAWRYLPDLNWGMSVQMYRSEALAAVEHMRHITLLVLTALLLLSALFMRAVQRRFSAAEQDLLHSHKLLNEAQRIAKLGSWDYVLQSKQTSWSKELFVLFDISENDFPDFLHVPDSVHPNDYQLLLNIRQQALQQSNNYQISYRLVLAGGIIRHVIEQGEVQFDAKGTAVQLRGTIQDISAQKQVEAKLIEEESHLQAIIDNAVDAIITINDRGCITSFNRAAESIFGYPIGEVLNHNIKMLMPSPYQESHDAYLQHYLTTSERKVIGIGRQVQGLRKNGNVFPMELAVSEISRQGQKVFIGLVRDISERVKMDKLKSEFISTVSHELRTPLTAINGSLKLLNSNAIIKLPDNAKPLVDIAARNSERLILLINDILDIEKIESGKMKFDMVNLPLMPLVEQTIVNNQAYADQYQIKVSIEQAIPNTLCVHADSHRLQQVLANLLSNAAKFSPAGSVVRIHVEQQNDKVRIAVKNSGSGISEEFRGRIFQKFSQADSSDTRQKGGTGLGLAISRAIVEQMGGHMDFNSEPNVETEFYFSLRVCECS